MQVVKKGIDVSITEQEALMCSQFAGLMKQMCVESGKAYPSCCGSIIEGNQCPFSWICQNTGYSVVQAMVQHHFCERLSDKVNIKIIKEVE